MVPKPTEKTTRTNEYNANRMALFRNWSKGNKAVLRFSNLKCFAFIPNVSDKIKGFSLHFFTFIGTPAFNTIFSLSNNTITDNPNN
jgi:hypothetical protein